MKRNKLWTYVRGTHADAVRLANLAAFWSRHRYRVIRYGPLWLVEPTNAVAPSLVNVDEPCS